MPYIKTGQSNERKKFDKVVKLMTKLGVIVNGDLNYILFKFCKYQITPSYNNYKNYCGELRQCATEIERKLLGPYEDKKIEENGDV